MYLPINWNCILSRLLSNVQRSYRTQASTRFSDVLLVCNFTFKLLNTDGFCVTQMTSWLNNAGTSFVFYPIMPSAVLR